MQFWLTVDHHSEKKNLNKNSINKTVNTYKHKLLMVKFSNTTPLPSRIFVAGVWIILFDPPSISMKLFNNDWGGLSFYKYLQTKHKKWILYYNHSPNKKKVNIFW